MKDSTVTHSGPRSTRDFPQLVRPGTACDAEALARAVKQHLSGDLLESGAILFRGFEIHSQDFERIICGVTPELLEYDYASTPRTRIKRRIYTTTEYPPQLKIPLHNEMAYTTSWPSLLWLYCDIASQTGGETPLADSREVYKRIDPVIRRRFIDKGILYTRTYNNGLDLPWQKVFGTEDRRVVEAYCRKAGITFEWLEDDLLKTRQVCQAVAKHPRTQQTVWFNQAHLFHHSSLRPDVRETLLAVVEEEDLPRNAWYGDGTPMEDRVLDEIRAVYQDLAVASPWEPGDLLLVDNLLAAHGRNPFSGERRILVAMA